MKKEKIKRYRAELKILIALFPNHKAALLRLYKKIIERELNERD
jgi:hypothetical protein